MGPAQSTFVCPTGKAEGADPVYEAHTMPRRPDPRFRVPSIGAINQSNAWVFKYSMVRDFLGEEARDIVRR